MKWDETMRAIVAEVMGDYPLTIALNGAPKRFVRNGANREKLVPSVEWFVVTSELKENTEALQVQLDIWATTYASAVAIEELLRDILHRDTPQTIGGIRMFTLLQDARDLPDPEPELIHRVLDFTIEHAR